MNKEENDRKYKEAHCCTKCGANCFNAGRWGKEKLCEECFDKQKPLPPPIK